MRWYLIFVKGLFLLVLTLTDVCLKVMANCFDVFSTWDDEYDKLQGLMRDIVKKKRDEHLKMVWRVNFSHKRYLRVHFRFEGPKMKPYLSGCNIVVVYAEFKTLKPDSFDAKCQ
jgi:hypothetical protein